MRFVTEEELRDLYKAQPFTSYALAVDARLTPGGRQFLTDRRICLAGPANVKEEPGAQERPASGKWALRLNTLANLALLTGHELLKEDVCMAGQVMDFQARLAGLGAGDYEIDPGECISCTGITPENCLRDLGPCFEITPFHAQTEKGRQILLLNQLRCNLAELAGELEEETSFCQVIHQGLNGMANRLSQMICTAFGGKECQRKD